MSRRDDYRSIAEQNQRIFEDGIYEAADGRLVMISEALEAAVQGTRIHSDPHDTTPHKSSAPPHITLSDETTLDAILRLANGGLTDVAVLNFASATSPGGGYLRGGNAQEESLCRATTLYPALSTQTVFYERNQQYESAIYAGAALYTPQVQVIRDRWNTLLSQPVACAVITCPAPNRRALLDQGADAALLSKADEAIRFRVTLIFDILRRHGHRSVILGAWGCGVFANDPDVVAAEFLKHLRTGGDIERAHFAIPDLDRSDVGVRFQKHLGSTS